MLKQFKKGFTLAEVLIVIGIIGVVAALTLPNLNHATGDKETVTRVKKAVSVITEATDRAQAIYGPISTWKSNAQCANDMNTCLGKRISEFLKFSKFCNQNDGPEAETYVSCNSLSAGDFSALSSGIGYQFPDGMTFTLNGCNSDCIDEDYTMYGPLPGKCCDEIYIDVNGPNKGKNKSGVDVFRFILSEELGLLGDFDECNYSLENCCATSRDAHACTWWVVEYGNLDYLKADDEGKCPNGTQLSATQTSCN